MPTRPDIIRTRQPFWHRLPMIAMLLPLTAFEHASDATAHLRIPVGTAPTVRLALVGRIRISTSDVPYIDVTTRVTLRGRTLGSSNARRRPPYQLVSQQTGDTVVVASAPRASLRAAGISWERESFDHVMLLPAASHLLFDSGVRDIEIDGTRVPRCSTGRVVWTRRTGSVCQSLAARTPPAAGDGAFAYAGMMRLGTGAGEYPMRVVAAGHKHTGQR